jgi:hypothetical protein
MKIYKGSDAFRIVQDQIENPFLTMVVAQKLVLLPP